MLRLVRCLERSRPSDILELAAFSYCYGGRGHHVLCFRHGPDAPSFEGAIMGGIATGIGVCVGLGLSIALTRAVVL